MKISVYTREDNVEVPDGSRELSYPFMRKEEFGLSAKIERFPIFCIREDVVGENIARYFVIKDDQSPATLSSLFKEKIEAPAHLWSENYDLNEEIKRLKESSLFYRIFKWKKGGPA